MECEIVYMRDKIMETKNIECKNEKYAKYIGKKKIKTTVLDNFCDEIQQKYGYDVACRLLSAAQEFLEKEELKNFGYKLVSLGDLTVRELRLFPGIFDIDFYDNYSIDASEKGVCKCLYGYPIFDHSYAIYKNRKLLCVCAEPYNVSGKKVTDFIIACERAGNCVEISGRGMHFPGRTLLIKIFPKVIPEITIVKES